MNQRDLYRDAHWYFLARAVSRGPRYLLGYMIRRSGRQLLWRLTRGMR